MADGADKARAGGFPLACCTACPIAYKDLCDIAGRIGTGGSKMFEKRVATETSNTVERLTAAGMVPLGKLHMVEFAFGGWGTNPLMGAPWNPWDLADPSRPAARRAAPASPSPRGSRRPASAATPAARCVFPRRSTAWSA